MPTKRLPDSANLDQLKRQAKELLRAFRAGHMAAFQRVREFHPKFAGIADTEMAAQTFSLSDAHLSLAREYGYASWPRLKAVIAERQHEELVLIHNDRLPDGAFKQALDFIDAGDEARLSAHLARHPDLVHQRVSFEGENYFTNPTLLEFVPENPIRQGHLPENAVAIARILLEAGAKHDSAAVTETAGLAASGRICREAGLQGTLLSLLCAYGADPNACLSTALGHGEFAAAETLIACGATLDLPAAASLDDREAVARLLEGAETEQLQLALAFAAHNGRAEIVHMLLAAGADPSRYNPPGGHSHCTPLHSAVAANQFETVVALVQGGADLTMTDIHHSSTPLDWATYMKHKKIADYLAAPKP